MGMNPRLLRPLATSRYAALRAGLLGYWPMGESALSGDVTASDASGRGNNLTSNNSVLSTPGKINNARAFVAENSEWLSVTSADFEMGDAKSWTMSLWFFIPTAAPNTLMVLVGKDVNNARQFNLGFNSPLTNSLFLSVFTTNSILFDASFSNVSRNEWHLFTATHAANASTVELTLDRTNAATVTRTSGTFQGFTNSALNVGRREFSGFNQHFTGNIDELAIWSRVLSSAELDTIWNSGSGIDMRR